MFAGERKLSRLPPRSAIVAFSAEEVYAIAELIRRQRGGVGLDPDLPRGDRRGLDAVTAQRGRDAVRAGGEQLGEAVVGGRRDPESAPREQQVEQHDRGRAERRSICAAVDPDPTFYCKVSRQVKYSRIWCTYIITATIK